MLPSLAAHPDVRLVAAAAPRAEARAAFASAFGARTYETAAELCASPEVDVVYLATPHGMHAEQTVRAAAEGKHVLVEKPMALTLAECDEMIDASGRSGTVLMVGPSHGYDRPILAMREIISGGLLGRVGMILSFDYTSFLYRPRRPEELDTSLGGGIIFNQVPHQIDMVRLLAGPAVRGVRSATGIWDAERPTEGSHATFLDFESGAAASLVYSGYDRFDSDELHGWIGEGGDPKPTGAHGGARRALRSASSDESMLKKATGFGGSSPKRPLGARPEEGAGPPHFGVTIVSCERGDLRTVPRGIAIFDDDGRRDIALPLGPSVPDKSAAIDELHAAVALGRPPVHDGRWGRDTLEVCLAILESARTRREVSLSQTTPGGTR